MTTKTSNHRIQQLERLLEVSRNLSAIVDLEPLLQSIVEAAAELTQSEEASILLHDQMTNELKFVAAPWFKRDVIKNIRVPLEGSITGEAFTTGEPVIVHDTQNDSRLFRAVDEAANFKTHSMLAVPMLFQGKATGVLSAVNKGGNLKYSDEDLAILETLASQAAIAIKNATFLKESQERYKELAEFDRMKTDFIAITSHELRTPLGLILGHATFLNEVVPEEMRKQLDVIVRSAMRLKEIIEDLSKVSTFESGEARIKRRPVNLNLLVQDLVNAYQDLAADKEITLKSKLPANALKFEGDAEKINIALTHLVKNAITFTDKGGVVELSAEEIPGFVKVNVIDTGIGIPQKDLERIFERFYQVEEHMTRRHGGMGLGLSVATLMVEMHGGRIAVESVEGKGSKFSIMLPTSASQVSAAQRVFNDQDTL